MIKLYGFPQTRSSRVAWALEEAGAEYEYELVNLRAGEHKQPGFLAINPFGKIPTLLDDGHAISESAAICTYIAEKFSAAKLIPIDIKARSEYFQWLFFVVSELEVHLWTANISLATNLAQRILFAYQSYIGRITSKSISTKPYSIT
jgi:glutathione S-transferase